ncbi:MAG TPA: NUDIX domain-containing protein [bacterium]
MATLSLTGSMRSLAWTAQHAVAVDVVVFTVQGRGAPPHARAADGGADQGTLKVLLVRRDQPPFRGDWALPGGRVGSEESVDAAALRALQEDTSIGNIYLEQLYTFGDPTRDPRGRVLTVSYYALVSAAELSGPSATWFPVKRLPRLAFDHRRIIDYALERLRSKINYTTVGFQLLPPAFTLTDLQHCYEVILGQRLDKRNFRRKMLQLGILRATRQFKMNGRQRPAKLYTFMQPKVIKLQERGIIVPF